jgi:hypothetical protein
MLFSPLIIPQLGYIRPLTIIDNVRVDEDVFELQDISKSPCIANKQQFGRQWLWLMGIRKRR